MDLSKKKIKKQLVELQEIINSLKSVEKSIDSLDGTIDKTPANQERVFDLYQKYIKKYLTSRKILEFSPEKEDLLKSINHFNEFCKKEDPDVILIKKYEDMAVTIQLTDLLFKNINEALNPAPIVQKMMGAMRLSIFRDFNENPELIIDPTGDSSKFLEMIIDICMCHDEFSGVRGHKFLEQLYVLTEAMSKTRANRKKVYRQAIPKLVNFVNTYYQQSQKIEDRVILEEKLISNDHDAKIVIAKEIRRVLSDQFLPSILIKFLNQIWSKYLYVISIAEGMDSAAWHTGIEDIRLFVWSITVRNSDELWELYADKIYGVIERMQKAVEGIHHGFKEVDAFFEEVECIHLAILNGEQPDLRALDDVSSTLVQDKTPHGEIITTMDLVRDLKAGDWIVLKVQTRMVKAKVIFAERQCEYLLFVNFSGERLCCIDAGLLAEQFTCGDAYRLQKFSIYPNLIKYLIHTMELHLDLRRMHLSDLTKVRSLKRKEEKYAEFERDIATRLQHEQENLEKQQMEEKERELQLKNKQLKDKLALKIRAKEEKIANLKKDISRLYPGAIVELVFDDGSKHDCKLGMIFEATGKMVFLNRNGMKVAERYEDELAINIFEGEESIKSSGVSHENSIQSLVTGRRKKLKDEDTMGLNFPH